MIVSHRHKFIFIKAVKVAGTSVEYVLQKHCGPKDIVISNNWRAHTDVKDAKKEYADVWDDYLKLTVIRNPWDMAVSYYYWSLRNRAIEADQPLDRLYSNPMVFAKDLDLYLRFENLQSDFDSLMDRLELQPQNLPRLNEGSRPSYHDFFKDRPSDRDAIGKIAKEYCDTFGYSY